MKISIKGNNALWKSKQGSNLLSTSRDLGSIYSYIMSVKQRLNFGFGRLHENQIQESISAILISWLQSLHFYENTYIECISHKLADTLQVRLFTNNKKLKSLFFLKTKNLMTDNIKESSLPFYRKYLRMYNNCLSCVTILLLYLPQKTLRHFPIFNVTVICNLTWCNFV